MSKAYYIKNKHLWRGYYNTRRQKAPLYATWRSMMTRCGHIFGAKPHEVKRYINRGIKVCKEWRRYETFDAWSIENGWKRGLQIDRIDNDGNYEPNNCRFVTARQNTHNRASNLFVTYNGERMRLVEAYSISGCKLNYKLVNNRIRKGWCVERALKEKTK